MAVYTIKMIVTTTSLDCQEELVIDNRCGCGYTTPCRMNRILSICKNITYCKTLKSGCRRQGLMPGDILGSIYRFSGLGNGTA